MTKLFLLLLEKGIAAGWLVAALLILRLILAKAVPKRLLCLLWALVAIRLLCPLTLESGWSLLPQEALFFQGQSETREEENWESSPVPSTEFFQENPQNGQMDWATVGAAVWAVGAGGMVAYLLGSFSHLYWITRTAVRRQEGIYECDRISSPFLLGLFRPRIILPFSTSSKDIPYIIAHERAHIRRKDHWWKPLGFLLLSIYWFHPLLWVGYLLLCQDIEQACDEQVIEGLNGQSRADYLQTLVNCSVPQKQAVACPLAFGGANVKSRIQNVLRYRKPALWVMGIVGGVGLLLGAFFLTNPLSASDHLTCRGIDSLSSSHTAFFDASLGQHAKSGSLWVEQWSHGRCTPSAPVQLSRFVKEIQIQMTVQRDGGEASGVNVQLETGEYGGSLLTYFSLGEDKATGWSYGSYQEDQTLEIAPGDQRVLAVLWFDMGEGIRVFDCETLTRERERLLDAENAVVVWASFSEDELDTQENAVIGGADGPTEIYIGSEDSSAASIGGADGSTGIAIDDQSGEETASLSF